MSKSMFANPKAALGFAGVTIAIAITASFAASAFLPQAPAEPEVVAQPEAVKAVPAQPARQTAWADDEFADDWDASAVDTASAFGSGKTGLSPSEQPEFGDYTGTAGSSAPEAMDRSPASPRAAQGTGPRIQSGAAPNAPPLQGPGGNESATLERVD